MQKQRREHKRMPVSINIRLFSEQLPYNATMIDCSKNGIGMNTFYNCLPCRNKISLLIPLENDILRLHGNIVRIKKRSEINFNIGIELVKPTQQYLDFIDSLSYTHNA